MNIWTHLAFVTWKMPVVRGYSESHVVSGSLINSDCISMSPRLLMRRATSMGKSLTILASSEVLVKMPQCFSRTVQTEFHCDPKDVIIHIGSLVFGRGSLVSGFLSKRSERSLIAALFFANLICLYKYPRSWKLKYSSWLCFL